IQESLNNIVKHSGAGRASISVVGTGSSLEIKVSDDGVGFDPNAKDRTHVGLGMIGLNTIRERVALLGGTCGIESSTGKGTSIEISIPHGPASKWTKSVS